MERTRCKRLVVEDPVEVMDPAKEEEEPEEMERTRCKRLVVEDPVEVTDPAKEEEEPEEMERTRCKRLVVEEPVEEMERMRCKRLVVEDPVEVMDPAKEEEEPEEMERTRCKRLVVEDPVEVMDPAKEEEFSESVKARVFEKAKEMLEFLEFIEDKHLDFFKSPKFLRASFARFECWIDLLKQNSASGAENLYPPIDVAFIWHAYMIRTGIYLEDIEKIAPGSSKWAKKICWKWNSSEEITSHSKKLWDENSGKLDPSFASYSLPISLDALPEKESVLPYQLKMEFLLEDLKWIRDLRSGWSAFTETRCQFLSDTLEKYFKWLYEAYKGEEANESDDGPTIDLDIFWHAHILAPELYEIDVVRLYGKVIWHRPKADEKSC